MNSVKRVSHGCRPSELRIGPTTTAKLISGRVAISIKNEIKKKHLFALVNLSTCITLINGFNLNFLGT